jgi:hypothetical protein
MKSKIKNPKIIVIIYSAVFLLACNFDVNTSDPQQSVNIAQSKGNNLFVSEYDLEDIDTSIFNIKEAWLEKSWRWETNFFNKKRLVTGGYQLNLLLDSFHNTNFSNENYNSEWMMKNNLNDGYFGIQYTYFLFLKKKIVPDTLRVLILKVNEDGRGEIFGHFTLKRKR